MKKIYPLFVFSALFLSLAISVFGQTPTATLTGTVTDQNGAVISGANVSATNKATNLTRKTTTRGDGIFVFPNLPVGEYLVEIDVQNFKKYRFEAVALTVGQTLQLNPSLEPAGPNVTLDEDFGAYQPVDTQTTKVDSVIASKEIENLPLNGRNFLELALLTPGNTIAPNFDPTKTNTVVISSAGGLGRGGNVMIDGTDNNDDVVGGALINISQDAVQEFQIATNRFSAEYGRSASSVINVVTKSGTNALRGSVSFFERDKSLQALPATFDRSLEAPPFDRQQYSFTLGGPIRRDRAWAFGAFEFRNQDGATLVGIRNVATRTIARGFSPAPLDNYLLNGRADFRLDEANDLNFRYSFEDVEARGASKLDRAIGSASYQQDLKNRFHALMAGWTNIISPTTLNIFSFSLNNFANVTNPVSTGIQYTFPSILDGSSFRVPQATEQNRIQIADSLTTIVGNHTVKFGGEFQNIKSSINLGVFRQGRIEFVQDFATFDHNNDGQINDNDLLFAVTLRSGKPNQDLSLDNVDNKFVALFIQNDWRVRQNLTLNLGLRYEVDTNVKNVSWYDEINPLVAGFYRGDRRPDHNNFAPRVGFNLGLLDGKLSIRGGYGIYYDRVTSS